MKDVYVCICMVLKSRKKIKNKVLINQKLVSRAYATRHIVVTRRLYSNISIQHQVCKVFFNIHTAEIQNAKGILSAPLTTPSHQSFYFSLRLNFPYLSSRVFNIYQMIKLHKLSSLSVSSVVIFYIYILYIYRQFKTILPTKLLRLEKTVVGYIYYI